MLKCPGCDIGRPNISTPCPICGYKPTEAQAAPQPTPSAQRPTRVEEKTLWQGHPSGLYYVGHWIVGVLLLMFGGVGLLVIIYAILDRNAKIFTLTTRKVMAQSGIVSRKTSEVAMRDIRSINMSQGILERIFGLGTVQIGSAGHVGIEVELKGIQNPAQVRDQVRRAKDDLEM